MSNIIWRISELNPEDLPPLDENGIPKYKGKKRGRKPKTRKRKANPNRRKRQHTAYTLYVQEIYPRVKAANLNLASKDVISIVAKRWGKEISAEEKSEWKARALATHEERADQESGSQNLGEDEEEAAAAAAAAAAVEEVDEDEDDEDDEADEENHEEEEEVAAPPARRSRRSKPR